MAPRKAPVQGRSPHGATAEAAAATTTALRLAQERPAALASLPRSSAPKASFLLRIWRPSLDLLLEHRRASHKALPERLALHGLGRHRNKGAVLLLSKTGAGARRDQGLGATAAPGRFGRRPPRSGWGRRPECWVGQVGSHPHTTGGRGWERRRAVGGAAGGGG